MNAGIRHGKYGTRWRLDLDRVCGCKVGGVMRGENPHARNALVGGDLRAENQHAGPIGSYAPRRHGNDDPGPIRKSMDRMRTWPLTSVIPWLCLMTQAHSHSRKRVCEQGLLFSHQR